MAPIFIHHETDEKPQTGGKSKQEYVKTCIQQASKFNENVILFGDEANKEYSEKWVNVNSFSSEKWDSFLSVYHNYSTYPDAWAKGIFKRFFIFEEYMTSNNIDACIIMDSDVMLYCDINKVFDLSEYDVALEMYEQETVSATVRVDEVIMAAVMGLGYMNRKAITSFTDFCINSFKYERQEMLDLWNYTKENNLPGGVCEMTLLYLWHAEKCNEIRFLNLGLKIGECLPVVDLSDLGKCYEKNILLDKTNKPFCKECVDVQFVDGMPYVFVGEKKLRVYALHFVGAFKIFIESFNNNMPYTGRGYYEWCYWQIRGKAVRLVKGLFK